MRAKWLGTIAVVAVLFAGCSDDGDDSSPTTTTVDASPIDLSAAADTPFCQAFVSYFGALDALVINTGGDRQARELFVEFKGAAKQMADTAPAEVQSAAATVNTSTQSYATWADFFTASLQQGLDTASIDAINAFVTSSCGLDVAALGEQLQQKATALCLAQADAEQDEREQARLRGLCAGFAEAAS